jgi:hypothetical protein
VLAIAIFATLFAASPAGTLAADASPSPEASLTPEAPACESVEDPQLIVEFLQGSDVSEDGWLPVAVGVIGGLSEARTLAGLVSDVYQPLVDDLATSIQGLGATADELRAEETAGAKVAAVGVAITEVGNAMDALGVQLRTRCPNIE